MPPVATWSPSACCRCSSPARSRADAMDFDSLNNLDAATVLTFLARASYLVAAALFILGIKRMASPVTVCRGIMQAGIGMVVATVATFAITGTDNLGWIIAGLLVG